MVMDTKTQRVRCWLGDLGSQVRNSFDSFVVRVPKIELLSTKTARSISVAGSSPAMSFEPSAQSSCATARDQRTNDNTRLLRRNHTLPNLPPIAEEEESGKTAVREAILALRLAVNNVDQASTQEPNGQLQRRDSRKLRESKLRRHQDAFLGNSPLSSPSHKQAVEQAPGSISADRFKRRDGLAFVAQAQRSVSVDHFKRREEVVSVAQAQRRSSVSSAEKEHRLWRSLSLSRSPRRSSM